MIQRGLQRRKIPATIQRGLQRRKILRLYEYIIPNQQRVVCLGILIANQEEREDWFPVS
jgi:hypothetical protein